MWRTIPHRARPITVAFVGIEDRLLVLLVPLLIRVPNRPVPEKVSENIWEFSSPLGHLHTNAQLFCCPHRHSRTICLPKSVMCTGYFAFEKGEKSFSSLWFRLNTPPPAPSRVKMLSECPSWPHKARWGTCATLRLHLFNWPHMNLHRTDFSSINISFADGRHWFCGSNDFVTTSPVRSLLLLQAFQYFVGKFGPVLTPEPSAQDPHTNSTDQCVDLFRSIYTSKLRINEGSKQVGELSSRLIWGIHSLQCF